LHPRPRLVVHDWDPKRGVPCGYTPRSAPRYRLKLAGILVTGFTHLPAVLVAAAAARSDTANLVGVIPVAGSLIMVGRRNPAWLPALAPFAAIDAIGQAVGLGLLVGGTATREPVLVRDDIAAPRIMPMPMVLGGAGAGVGLAGTF
jgi:hypothetical protein